MRKFFHRNKLTVLAYLMWSVAFLFLFAGFTGATVVVDSNDSLVNVTYPAGESVSLKLKAEPGQKTWIWVECPILNPAFLFARPTDGFPESAGKGISRSPYLLHYWDNGYYVPNARDMFYSAAYPGTKIDLGTYDFNSLGSIIFNVRKGELHPELLNSGVTSIQTIVLSRPAKPASADVSVGMLNILGYAVKQAGLPGAVMMVKWPDGTEWFATTGVSDLAQKTPMDIDNKFKVGSITKTFVSTVIIQLAQENLRGLDDSVEKWLPGMIPNGKNITIRECLNHTSGIFNYSDMTDPNSIYWAILKQPLKKWKPEELIAYAVSKPVTNPPGLAYNYSNTNYIVMGLIAQKATNTTIESEVTRRIITKMGLTNTSFPTDPLITGKYSRGYDLNATGPADDVTIIDPSGSWAAGAMISNVKDLMRYLIAYTNGDLVTPAMQAQRITFVDGGAAQNSFGYGLGISLTDGYLGHLGEIYGYEASMYRYQGVYIVIMANGREVPGTPGISAFGVPQTVYGEILPILFGGESWSWDVRMHMLLSQTAVPAHDKAAKGAIPYNDPMYRGFKLGGF
ncbi:MAG: beta-lactamase family protein [Deltaproteobacteria bacterium]|nr:beta-lactamase family protein [Deltaproteobacteria bacterium]